MDALIMNFNTRLVVFFRNAIVISVSRLETQLGSIFSSFECIISTQILYRRFQEGSVFHLQLNKNNNRNKNNNNNILFWGFQLSQKIILQYRVVDFSFNCRFICSSSPPERDCLGKYWCAFLNKTKPSIHCENTIYEFVFMQTIRWCSRFVVSTV